MSATETIPLPIAKVGIYHTEHFRCDDDSGLFILHSDRLDLYHVNDMEFSYVNAALKVGQPKAFFDALEKTVWESFTDKREINDPVRCRKINLEPLIEEAEGLLTKYLTPN